MACYNLIFLHLQHKIGIISNIRIQNKQPHQLKPIYMLSLPTQGFRNLNHFNDQCIPQNNHSKTTIIGLPNSKIADLRLPTQAQPIWIKSKARITMQFPLIGFQWLSVKMDRKIGLRASKNIGQGSISFPLSLFLPLYFFFFPPARTAPSHWLFVSNKTAYYLFAFAIWFVGINLIYIYTSDDPDLVLLVG